MNSQGEFYYNKVKDTIAQFGSEYSVAEIGTDGGTTAFWAMKAMKDVGDKKWFFTIDPYGDKPYKAGLEIQGHNMGYNDNHYRSTVSRLSKYAMEADLHHLHWKLTSLDFMKIYPQITFWSEGAKLRGVFCFAMLDGDHNWDPVMQEFEWFLERMPSGGVICIDDFNLLNGEAEVRSRLEKYQGKWEFNYDDNHYRCYFTKE
jgi:hypothetical protein